MSLLVKCDKCARLVPDDLLDKDRPFDLKISKAHPAHTYLGFKIEPIRGHLCAKCVERLQEWLGNQSL